MPYTVIIADNDPASQSSLRSIVSDCNYSPRCTDTGAEALELVFQESPALLLLALMLPDMDGFDVCRQLRNQSSIPIIIVSSRNSEVDRICAFELGADDYLTKPFRRAELTCRIQALMRTAYSNRSSYSTGPSLQFDGINIEPDSREVIVGGESVHLTPKEFELLLALAGNHDNVISSQWLLLHIWGYDESIRTRTLDVHINRLRSKIEPDTEKPRYIQTVFGVGYSFKAAAA